MAIDKLGLYNNALTILGERKLATEFEARRPRYVLDDVWNLGAVEYCLELTKPHFAQKTEALTSPTTSSEHAFDQVYTLPIGYISLVGNNTIYSDAELEEPIKRYLLEGRTIATDVATTIYLRYITKAVTLSQWTPAFSRLVVAFLAKEAASKLNPSKLEESDRVYKDRLAIVAGLEGQKEDPNRPSISTQTLDAHWINIYNGALQILGEREVISDKDDSLRRVALDKALGASEEAVDACLELARPKFAVVTDLLSSGSSSSEHGYSNVFTLEANYMSIIAVYYDTLLDQPITRYFIEGRTIATDVASIRVRYLRNDSTNSEWTPAFKRLVSAYLAKEVAPQILTTRGDTDLAKLEAALTRVGNEYTTRLQQAIDLEGDKEPEARPLPATITLDAHWIEVYNGALRIAGLPPIVDNIDGSPRRIALDYASEEAVDACLELARPKFAVVTDLLSSGSSSSEHGYSNVFTLEANYMSLIAVYYDTLLDQPITRYFIEGRTIATDVDSIRVRYLRNDSTDSEWTPAFKRLVSAYLAKEVAPQLLTTGDGTDLVKLEAALTRVGSEYTTRLQQAIDLEGDKEPEARPLPATVTLDAHWIEIYNGALRIAGLPPIVDNTDGSPRRIALDYALGASFEAVDACLELAAPRFATVVDKITSSSPGVEHDYTNVFTVAADYIRILGLYQDSILDQPVNRYFIEGRTIAANYSTIYLRYVMRDPTNSEWTPTFKRLVSAYLAKEIAPELLREDPESQAPSSTYSSKSVMAQELLRIGKEYNERLEYAIQVEGAKEPDPRPAAASVTLTAAWLSLYNTALEIARMGPLLSASDDSERRRALDEAINNDAVLTVLTKIPWNHAYNSVKLDYDPTLVPAWGHKFVFAVPSDMERIDMLSTGEFFQRPYHDYYREGAYFYSGVQELYLRYISTDTMTNPTSWPTYFRNVVAGELARRVSYLPGADADAAEKKYEEYKREAFSTDAQRNPPQVLGTGNWVDARYSENTRRNGRP